jgi:hypothetical protein
LHEDTVGAYCNDDIGSENGGRLFLHLLRKNNDVAVMGCDAPILFTTAIDGDARKDLLKESSDDGDVEKQQQHPEDESTCLS